jgi:hypothetical protein
VSTGSVASLRRRAERAGGRAERAGGRAERGVGRRAGPPWPAALRPQPRAVFVAVVIGLAGCGESEEEKAQNQVCDARDDINKQIEELQSLPLNAASLDQAKGHLSAIRSDLNQMVDAQDDLSSERKQQVQAANDTFVKQLESVASTVTSSGLSGDAKAQARSAFDQLAATYKQALAPTDCS